MRLTLLQKSSRVLRLLNRRIFIRLEFWHTNFLGQMSLQMGGRYLKGSFGHAKDGFDMDGWKFSLEFSARRRGYLD
jgi:hypothetical protein